MHCMKMPKFTYSHIPRQIGIWDIPTFEKSFGLQGQMVVSTYLSDSPAIMNTYGRLSASFPFLLSPLDHSSPNTMKQKADLWENEFVIFCDSLSIQLTILFYQNEVSRVRDNCESRPEIFLERYSIGSSCIEN